MHETEKKKGAISKILLSRARGDQIVENCLETKITINEVTTPIVTLSTRNHAIESAQMELWIEAERKEIESTK